MSAFNKFLNEAVRKKDQACSKCNYTEEIEGKPEEYKSPCKMGHEPSKDIKICKDCSEEAYRSNEKKSRSF